MVPLRSALPAVLLHQFHGSRNVAASVLKSAAKRITCPAKCSISCRKVLLSATDGSFQ